MQWHWEAPGSLCWLLVHGSLDPGLHKLQGLSASSFKKASNEKMAHMIPISSGCFETVGGQAVVETKPPRTGADGTNGSREPCSAISIENPRSKGC